MGKYFTTLNLLWILVLGSSCLRHLDKDKEKAKEKTEAESTSSQSEEAMDSDDDELIVYDSEFLNEIETSQELEAPSQVGQIKTYQTRKGDTLMLIAFHLYRDYRKWKDLFALNRNIIPDNYDLSHRPVLRYEEAPLNLKVSSGRPYLIKKGDTLSGISRKVYGDWKRWPLIYKNNPEQIRNPKLIFAGFTLFYPPFDEIALKD